MRSIFDIAHFVTGVAVLLSREEQCRRRRQTPRSDVTDPDTALFDASFGAGARCFVPSASDRRLKVEIEALGFTPGGVPLSSWRYFNGGTRFTGVIAQDLLFDERFADAIVVDHDGLMRVDYARLGYRPALHDRMIIEGEAAIASYRAAHRY